MKLLLLIQIILAATSISPAQDAGVSGNRSSAFQGVQITLSAKKTVVQANQPIELLVSVKNNTSQVLYFAFVPGISTFHITVHDDQMHTPPDTEKGCRMHLAHACNETTPSFQGSIQSVVIRSGQTFDLTLDANEEFDLTRTGTYVFSVWEGDFQLIDAPKDANTLQLGTAPHLAIGKVFSNSVKVTVQSKQSL